ncbi:MAG: FkbM family methyltransferase [Patescibacteria group bacterium]|nr:FkbM family methyltransferase [Patescibacteria group bacterium]
MLNNLLISLRKVMINLKIKKFLETIGLYDYIKNIYRSFIIFIGKNGLRLKIQDVSAKIIVSNPIEVSIWQSLCNEGEFLQKFLSKINHHTVFYDIGTHIGLYALSAAKYKITPKFIYCWEPEPFIFKRLQENINLNRIERILPFSVALGSENSIIEMSTRTGELGYFTPTLAIKSSKSTPVQVVKGDDWVYKKKLHLPSIIKIDVEGYEFNVLKGLEATIRQSKPIIFLEIHPAFLKELGIEKEQVLTFLREMDYKITFSSSRGKQEHYIFEPLNKKSLD